MDFCSGARDDVQFESEGQQISEKLEVVASGLNYLEKLTE